MRGDARLRALERLVDAGEADPRALLATRDRTREVLLPVPVCFGDQGYGGITECQPYDGGPCLGWGGEWTPLPTCACVLPPWEQAAMPNPATTLGRGDNAVLRRELVTGDLVLVPDAWWARCVRCRGSGLETARDGVWRGLPCAMCLGTGEQPWVDPEGEARAIGDEIARRPSPAAVFGELGVDMDDLRRRIGAALGVPRDLLDGGAP